MELMTNNLANYRARLSHYSLEKKGNAEKCFSHRQRREVLALILQVETEQLHWTSWRLSAPLTEAEEKGAISQEQNSGIQNKRKGDS